MKNILRIIKYLVLIGFIIIIFIQVDVVTFSMKAKPKESDCIIVLGCQVKGSDPSPFLQARLNECLRLYKEGYGKYIIVSGGKGAGEDITEAEAMKNFLLDKGISENNIVLEDKSTNTMDNLTFSKNVMDLKGFKTAVVVSNKYHLKRSSLMTKKLSMNTSFSGVFVSQYKLLEYKGYVREVLGIVKFWVLRK